MSFDARKMQSIVEWATPTSCEEVLRFTVLVTTGCNTGHTQVTQLCIFPFQAIWAAPRMMPPGSRVRDGPPLATCEPPTEVRAMPTIALAGN